MFDRCVLDILAYLHILDPNRDIQYLYEKTQAIITEIDLFVFVSVEDPDLIPSQQVEFPKLRTEVNNLLHEWVH